MRLRKCMAFAVNAVLYYTGAGRIAGIVMRLIEAQRYDSYRFLGRGRVEGGMSDSGSG